jgi:carboxyl-terminal processing protease
MKNHKYLLPLIFAVILSLGILFGNWYGTRFSKAPGSIHSVIQKNGNNDSSFSLIPRTNKISSVLSYIENEYVDTVNIDELTEAAIPAIINKLDPHSFYIPARDLSEVNEPLVGNFSGIGIQFNMTDDSVAVILTIPNGPSEIVGLMPGDRIIKVNDETIAGVKMPSDSIVKRLKGPKGTSVRVTVIRKGEDQPLEFEIIRDNIPLYSVDVAYMMDKVTGYMKITTFSQTTYKEFMEGIKKLHEQGMKKLILDLRNNGGGVMEAAILVADEFLPENKLIVYTQGKARPRSNTYSTSRHTCVDDELVILIDEYSASASEILAGAIQDNDRGTIVGRRSFGKGLVQEQVEFKDGSALRLTIARYYTPTGRSIQKPYDDNKEKYYHDIYDRYENGEFQNADSIRFADSLKYITPGGKVVYGGGGIMPDVFIPIDTIGLTTYYSRVRSLGLIYRYAFNYTDKNRDKLQAFKTADEINAYLESTKYYNDFVSFAKSKGVEPNWKEIKISKKIISTQIKAYIARNIIDNDGFYPIIKEIDQTLMDAEALLLKEE